MDGLEMVVKLRGGLESFDQDTTLSKLIYEHVYHVSMGCFLAMKTKSSPF